MKQKLQNLFLLLIGLLTGTGLTAGELTNTLPSAVITYPHSNAYYQEGSNITINVYSTDFGGTFPDGTVENVEILVDDVVVHETNEHQHHTYTYVWEDVVEGAYRITARATDNEGDTFTSAGVLVTVGQDPVIKKGISAGKGKYLGNIIGSATVRADFLRYWNGVTAENAHKWGSIEGTRDVMRWNAGDAIYDFADTHNLVFRYHAIAWGSQYPRWLENLEPNEFQAEIEEYMAEMAARYPNMDQIDVLNENLYLNTWNGLEHAAGTPYFREGLGGEGETGYDWVIWLFEKAREYFPNSKLVMNDFELENNPNGIREMLDVVKVLRDRGLIDGFGTQAHTFNVDGMWSNTTTLKQRIDLMASSGVPVYATELDLKGSPVSDQNQLRAYQNIFPVYWEHPAVAGITLWGYVEENMWSSNAGLIYANGTKKPAFIWLLDYMENQPDVGYPIDGEEMDNEDNIVANGEFNLGTIGWSVQGSATIDVVTDAGMSGSNALRICPQTTTANSYQIQVRYVTPIHNGRTYSLSFMAKADEERPFDVAIQQDGPSYPTYFQETETLTTDMQTFGYQFISTADSNNATLKFYIGTNQACLYIDKVEMYDLTGPTTNVPDIVSNEPQTKVTPNPFEDQITIELPSNVDVANWTILNLNGQIIKQGKISGILNISAGDLTAGFYLLRVNTNTTSETIKLIKK